MAENEQMSAVHKTMKRIVESQWKKTWIVVDLVVWDGVGDGICKTSQMCWASCLN